MRLLITTGLVLAWAMPPVVAVTIWTWMVDYEFGVAQLDARAARARVLRPPRLVRQPDRGLRRDHRDRRLGRDPVRRDHDLRRPDPGAGEIVEAASIDGSNAFRIFRDITLPILKPIFVILASLSVIWNFQVFSQIWIIRERPARGRLLPDGHLLLRDLVQRQASTGSAPRSRS